MPLPKYTCEYCRRTFNDSAEIRAQHFNSYKHKMNVKMWYDSIRDPNELALERAIPECVNWKITGNCSLGNSCPYAHSSFQDQDSATRVIPPGIFRDNYSTTKFEQWTPVEVKLSAAIGNLPPELREPVKVQSLPPSMIPAPKSVFNNQNPVEWGWDNNNNKIQNKLQRS